MSLTADSASGFYYSYEPNYIQYCSIAVRLVFFKLANCMLYSVYLLTLGSRAHTQQCNNDFSRHKCSDADCR